MPKSQSKKSAQRKLDFPAVEPSADEPGDDDDKLIIVLDDDDDDDDEKERQQVREASRKRSAPSHPRETSRRTISKAASTPNKGTATASIVTPATETTVVKSTSSTQVDDRKTAEYVPTYIHKNVEYHRKGEASNSLPSKTLNVFQLITDHYAIPKDLEQSRSYGPLSGSTYEERVISAYRLGKLKASDTPATIICTGCAEIGHERDECPTLL